MVDDINELRRRDRRNAVNFNAYRELANYANIIGKAIAGGNTPSANTDNIFALTTHGFYPYWTSKMDPNNYGIDLTPFLNMDRLDPSTNKRQHNMRANYLATELE
ncbi:MAG: hypothetical protein HUJ56_01760 [Erysipelotrichaceae bacterium]|nr:hypothetical protein [Erysipelotrichaceae bacterium]